MISLQPGASQGRALYFSRATVPAGDGERYHHIGLYAFRRDALTRFVTFQRVVDLIRANRDVKLLVEVEGGVRLVSYQPGRIEFEPSPSAAADLAQRLGSRLQSWTGARWVVTVANGGGQPTIAETRDATKERLRAAAAETPIVAAVLQAFPGARIGDLKTPEDIAASAAQESLAEVDEEWDPFEED